MRLGRWGFGREQGSWLLTIRDEKGARAESQVGGKQPRGPAWSRGSGERRCSYLQTHVRRCEEVMMEVTRRRAADTKFSVSGQEPLIWARPHSLGGALTEIPREPSRSA